MNTHKNNEKLAAFPIRSYARSLLLGLCLLQPVSYVYADPDVAEVRQAAKRGNANAQVQLGAMYSRGDFIPKDYRQAFAWTRKAAEQGHATAQLLLGDMYERGQGIPQNTVQAYAWVSVSIANSPSTNEIFIEKRDRLAAQMSPQQLGKAQKIATQYFELYKSKN